MKLLFDQNLSHRLCRVLADIFPESTQVRQVGLDAAGDEEIWRFAGRERFAIVTLDADFSDIATLRGFPPKIIWLRCGNQPNDIIVALLRKHEQAIVVFLSAEEAACIEIY